MAWKPTTKTRSAESTVDGSPRSIRSAMTKRLLGLDTEMLWRRQPHTIGEESNLDLMSKTRLFVLENIDKNCPSLSGSESRLYLYIVIA